MPKLFDLSEERLLKFLVLTVIIWAILFGIVVSLFPQTTKKETVITETKPTYAELKSHSVFIVGCSGDVDVPEKLSMFPIGEEGGCWAGTGGVIKVTDKETYILTNGHVTGKGKDDVILFVENGDKKVQARIIKQHSFVDIAVIRVPGKLDGKTGINKITSIAISDPVYVVGNPLRVKNVYSTGYMAGYDGISMLLQLPCIYGSSGSLIFDKDSNLVGIVFALEVYPGFMGIPTARITHTLAVDGISIKMFLKELGLYND
jgi:S1-C subfamily serine protease